MLVREDDWTHRPPKLCNDHLVIVSKNGTNDAQPMSQNEIRRRVGGRSARVRDAVLAATIEMLSEGAAAVNIGAVAQRTGVHETSIYRRWGTKENLALDALLAYSEQEIPLADTGTLRGDLIALGRLIVAYLSSPLGKALIRIAGEAPAIDPALGSIRVSFWARRFELISVIFERAKERGELPQDTDVQFALEAFISPFHFRAWLDSPMLEYDILKITDFVISACKSDHR